jgi:ribosomal protein S18 acetylase RimI-like enzyme
LSSQGNSRNERDLQKAITFMEGVEDRAAESSTPVEGGTLIANTRFPNVYSLNFLRLHPEDGPRDAGAAARLAHRLQGELQLTHRRVLVNDGAIGAELAPGFRALGWLADRLEVMAWRGSLERVHHAEDDVGRIEAEEFPEDEISEARRRYYGWRGGTPGTPLTEQVVDQLVEARRATAAAVRVRNVAAAAEGQLVSFCDLYSAPGIAQIEDVGTIEPFRRRGLSRAVMRKALELALAEDPDLVFLVADGEDWPKEFYRRLGFDSLGDIWEFTLLPDPPAAPPAD